MQDQEIIKQAQACLDAEANAIKEMKERIGSAFAEAVKAISACRGKW